MPFHLAPIVALVFRFQRFDALDFPILTDQPLDVSGCAVAGDHQQIVLVVRCRNAGHGADLREADPDLSEFVADLRQISQRMRHTDFFPRLISGKLSVEGLDIHFPPSTQEEP